MGTSFQFAVSAGLTDHRERGVSEKKGESFQDLEPKGEFEKAILGLQRKAVDPEIRCLNARSLTTPLDIVAGEVLLFVDQHATVPLERLWKQVGWSRALVSMAVGSLISQGLVSASAWDGQVWIGQPSPRGKAFLGKKQERRKHRWRDTVSAWLSRSQRRQSGDLERMSRLFRQQISQAYSIGVQLIEGLAPLRGVDFGERGLFERVRLLPKAMSVYGPTAGNSRQQRCSGARFSTLRTRPLNARQEGTLWQRKMRTLALRIPKRVAWRHCSGAPMKRRRG